MKAKATAMLAAALCLGLAATALGALTCPQIDLSLDKNRIDMGMTYDGEDVTVSGNVPAGSQVAVVLISKDNPPLQLARKGRVGLFWMAVKQLEACNLPFLYQVYSSGPLTSVASPAAIKELGLGYEDMRRQLVAKCTKGEPAADDAEVLFGGFLKLKEEAGLYGVQEGVLTVNAGGRFQQALSVSDRVPEGTYFVHAYAFKDGQLVGRATREMTTQKIGLSKWLVVTAQHNGVLYGAMAVVVALGAGLGIGAIFKKGASH
jgi:uncharacterized protein (TIGR02186 family)